MFVAKALVAAYAVAALASALKFKSPCPDVFRYDSSEIPGEWTGTLTFRTPSDLHGVWARLFFSDTLVSLTLADPTFGEILPSGNNEYLIKNAKQVLKARTPVDLKIIVKYDGNKVPTLIGYRLNAIVVCPEQQSIESGNFFAGDLGNKDFISKLQSKLRPSSKSDVTQCGTNPLYKDNDGKTAAGDGQWPWQAALYIQNQNREDYICSATLISPQHLLTTAHCVTWQNSDAPVIANSLIARLRVTQSPSVSGSDDEHKFNVEKVFLYPGYNTDSLLNDLAIVRLDRKVAISDHIRPICLGDAQNLEIGGLLVGHRLTKDGQYGELTDVKLARIGNEQCVKEHPTLASILVDNGYCGKFVDDKSVCVGNSGSGVASLRSGAKPVWELRGVVTVGVGLQNNYECNESSFVYLADVAKYTKWIQAIIF